MYSKQISNESKIQMPTANETPNITTNSVLNSLQCLVRKYQENKNILLYTGYFLFIDSPFTVYLSNTTWHKVYLVSGNNKVIYDNKLVYITYISADEFDALGRNNLFEIKQNLIVPNGIAIDADKNNIVYAVTKISAPKSTQVKTFKVIKNPFTDIAVTYGIFTEENVQEMLAMLNVQTVKMYMITLVDCRLIVNSFYDVQFQIVPM